MNLQHFQAFVWLRWRLRLNQLKRAGTVNAVLLGILGVGLILMAVGLFFGSFAFGLLVLADNKPFWILCAWDGLIVAFFFTWSIGLLIDLQQSEVLSLDKFLHLPVSLSGAFVINYLSSLFSAALVLFVPAMVGLALSLIVSRGPAMLPTLPLLVAFLFMVTASTHQFRSWLGSLMVNKRRRRTVIVVVTMVFVLLFQLPNLLNILRPWGEPKANREIALEQSLSRALGKLNRSREARQITLAEFKKRWEQIQQEHDVQSKELLQRRIEEKEQSQEEIKRIVWIANIVLPPGWLSLGAMDAAEGNFLTPLLGTVGLTLIGSASLWRSYRTTVRMYTGQFTTGKRRDSTSTSSSTQPAPARKVPAVARTDGPPTLLEKKLPWVSEQASAIATASFRSLMRAPEVKMMFLSPVILVVVFGGLLARNPAGIAEAFRCLIAFAAMMTVLLSMIQLIGNQFGFDRSGFRVLVLCSAPRKEILLGKNLAFAPLVLGIGGFMVLVMQFLEASRLRWDHFLATIPQFISMYLLYCLLANCLAILAPVAVASGSMKMSNVRAIPMLLHLAFVLIFPVVLAPTLLPLGIEYLIEELGSIEGLPINLLLSVLECGVVILLYKLLLPAEGLFLQAREQAILAAVAAKAES